MNRHVLLLVLIIILSILLTGCWSYREVDSLYIIAGIAIDKVPDTNLYTITSEFINIMENKMTKEYESLLLENKGESIFDAVEGMIRISAKRPYWQHATTIIISDQVAREGIMPFLDVIVRNKQPRLYINVYISKEKTARQILETKSFSTDIRSYELDIMVNENKHFVTVPALKVYEVINQLEIPKVHIVLPTVMSFDNNGTMTNLLSGGAIFSQGKLVGYLDEEDVIPYLFIRDKVKAGNLKVKTKENNPKNIIVLDVFDSSTKIKPIYGNEMIGFDIKVNADVSIAELTTMTDYISEGGREELKGIAEAELEEQIKAHIEDIQDTYGFDIFGFGSIIRQRNPKLWKQIEKDWDQIFTELDFTIKCDITIKDSGHIIKPLKVVD